MEQRFTSTYDKSGAETQPHNRPYIAYCLLAILVAIFGIENIAGAGPSAQPFEPDLPTLVALGGLSRNLALEGHEWWRLFSGPLLHGGATHILFNGAALLVAGALLENVIGRVWFAAVFAVSALAGALFSISFNPPALVSVGASGAIMGLFGAAFVVSYRFPRGSFMRSRLFAGSLQVLVASLLPLAGAVLGINVDYAAHAGGACAGAICGAFFLFGWPSRDALPPFRAFAFSLALAGAALAMYSAAAIATTFGQYAQPGGFIPQTEIPEAPAEAKAQAEALVKRYPGDPRGHFFRALALLDENKAAQAEDELREALKHRQSLRAFFKPDLEEQLLAALAITLNYNGKKDEALSVAEPLCFKSAVLGEELSANGLCPPR